MGKGQEKERGEVKERREKKGVRNIRDSIKCSLATTKGFGEQSILWNLRNSCELYILGTS